MELPSDSSCDVQETTKFGKRPFQPRRTHERCVRPNCPQQRLRVVKRAKLPLCSPESWDPNSPPSTEPTKPVKCFVSIASAASRVRSAFSTRASQLARKGSLSNRPCLLHWLVPECNVSWVKPCLDVCAGSCSGARRSLQTLQCKTTLHKTACGFGTQKDFARSYSIVPAQAQETLSNPIHETSTNLTMANINLRRAVQHLMETYSNSLQTLYAQV